jgi:hypothetical protein
VLSVRQFAAQYEQFEQRNIHLARIFHSPPEALTAFAPGPDGPPFPVLADPKKRVYRLFGVTASLFGLLKPGAYKRVREATKQGLKPKWRDSIRDGFLGTPADFLIGPDNRFELVRYGKNFTDSLPVDEFLSWSADLQVG